MRSTSVKRPEAQSIEPNYSEEPSALLRVLEQWVEQSNYGGKNVCLNGDRTEARFEYSTSAEGEVYTAYFDLDIRQSLLLHFQYSAIEIPPARHAAVARFIAFINTRISVGCFDVLMEDDDGRVRFRCGAGVEGAEISIEMLDDMNARATQQLDRYLPLVMLVAFANISPEKALLHLDDPENVEPYLINAVAEDEPPTWKQLPGSECIARWSREIGSALRGEADCLPWDLIGYGAIVQVEDIDTGRAILHRAAVEGGMGFTVIKWTEVPGVLLEEGDPFSKASPLLVYIEPGEWMRSPETDDKGKDEEILAFRRGLESYIRKFDPFNPVIFATSTFDLDNMVPKLRTARLFSRRFIVRRPTHEEAAAAFLDEIGLERCGSSLRNELGKLGELVRCYDSSRVRALHIQVLRRLSVQNKRPLEFSDLVKLGVSGTVETDNMPPQEERIRRRIAAHESGHAVAAIIDSGGCNTPEFLSIIGTPESSGVSVDSYAYHSTMRESMTYASMRHRVRVSLAGRGAEELVFGPEAVGHGAQEDLRKATELAGQAFARLGFAPAMGEEGQSASNLAVVGDEPTASEIAHVETLVRKFLATEYQIVLDMLRANRPLLDQLRKR